MDTVIAIWIFQQSIRPRVAVEGKSPPVVREVLEDSEMLVLSIIWLLLAVTVTLLAMKSRSGATESDGADVEAKESGNGIAVVAVVCALALIAGFLYVSKFLISNL